MTHDNIKNNSLLFEVGERKRLRVYSMIIFTFLLLLLFFTFAFLTPEYMSLFIGLGVFFGCPLGAFSFYEYSNNFRKKFSIYDEEIRLQKTYRLIKVRWNDFDVLRIKSLGEFSFDFPTISAIYRDFTKFRIRCIDQKNNRTIQIFKFRFYNKKKAIQLLKHLIQYAQIKNKKVVEKKKHMG